ncbi:UNVERIFIED_CONTAM: hypothetical protein NCL1_01432 [Trichonephila clavipes]
MASGSPDRHPPRRRISAHPAPDHACPQAPGRPRRGPHPHESLAGLPAHHRLLHRLQALRHLCRRRRADGCRGRDLRPGLVARAQAGDQPVDHRGGHAGAGRADPRPARRKIPAVEGAGRVRAARPALPRQPVHRRQAAGAAHDGPGRDPAGRAVARAQPGLGGVLPVRRRGQRLCRAALPGILGRLQALRQPRPDLPVHHPPGGLAGAQGRAQRSRARR